MSNIDLNDFQIISPLSEETKSVYKVKSLKNQKEYALKNITQTDLKAHLKEIQGVLRLLNCNHPNISKIYGFTIKEEKKEKIYEYQLFLLMELFQRSLYTEILERRQKSSFYSKDEILKIVQDLHSSLFYLQTGPKIAHRDIKPSNILISKEGNMVLSDFSESFIQTEVKEKSTSVVGTPYFMAPEIKEIYIRSDLSGKLCYNPWKTDVFSFGMTILDCATLTLAEKGNLDEKLKLVEKKYGKQLKEFIEACILTEESSRMDFVQLNESKEFLNLSLNSLRSQKIQV